MLPLGVPPGVPRTALFALDCWTCRPSVNPTFIVDGALEPPFCSQRLFLLMSPATISWGHRKGMSQVQTLHYGELSLLPGLARLGPRPAHLLPYESPGQEVGKGRRYRPPALGRPGVPHDLLLWGQPGGGHPSNVPVPGWSHTRLAEGRASPRDESYLAGGGLGRGLSLHFSRLPPALGARHGHAGQLDGGLAR